MALKSKSTKNVRKKTPTTRPRKSINKNVKKQTRKSVIKKQTRKSVKSVRKQAIKSVRKQSRKSSRKQVQRPPPKQVQRPPKPKKQVPQPNVIKTLTIPTYKTDKTITQFSGTPYYNLLVMAYLTFKFPNDCIIIPLEDIGNTLIRDVNHTDISIRYIEEDKKLSIPPNFWNYLRKCIGNKRFIVFPFGFTCIDGGHANYMIYDTKFKSLERFEPHGETIGSCITDPVDNLILKVFEQNLGKDFIKTYYKPLDFCPPINLQAIQDYEGEMMRTDPGGFCAAWSAFYADARLSNPDIDREDLINNLIYQINSSPKSFTEFIREYSIFLNILHDEVYKNIKKNKNKNISDTILNVINNFT